MRPGTIIYRGKSKGGVAILLRYPTMSDIRAMQNFINALSKERTFINRQGDQLSYAGEKKYVQAEIERIKKNRSVFLLAFSERQLVGCAGVSLRDGAMRHQASPGISIAKTFREQGIGSQLMASVLHEAKKHLKGVKIIVLGVFGNNQRAIRLYKKFGFRKYGSLPNGLFRRRKYADEHYMYRRI